MILDSLTGPGVITRVLMKDRGGLDVRPENRHRKGGAGQRGTIAGSEEQNRNEPGVCTASRRGE